LTSIFSSQNPSYPVKFGRGNHLGYSPADSVRFRTSRDTSATVTTMAEPRSTARSFAKVCREVAELPHSSANLIPQTTSRKAPSRCSITESALKKGRQRAARPRSQIKKNPHRGRCGWQKKLSGGGFVPPPVKYFCSAEGRL
jgi:hypothetical protein